MRIAVSSLNLPLDNVGGLQTRIRALVKGLLIRGHEVTLIETDRASRQSLNTLAALREKGWRSLPLPAA